MSERFEWLEMPKEKSEVKKKKKEESFVVEGRRCPRCKWLERADAVECFRCGYSFELQSIYDKFHDFDDFELPKRIIKFAELPKSFFTRKYAEDNKVYELRCKVEELNLSKGFGELICLNEVDIDHYEHQLETARKSLRDMRARVLLADEVGLGKTIEAGLIMKELIMRGLVKKILILTPASLVLQWKEEMEHKFGEDFYVGTNKNKWLNENKVIVSIDTAKQHRYAKDIHELEYDLLIVDEAHKLKNKNTKVYSFVNKIRKKYVLMLTATPVHNDLTELYNLATILKPGLLGTIRAFRRDYVDKVDKRLPINKKRLKSLLSEVMIRNQRDKVDVKLPLRKPAIYYMELGSKERELYDSVTEYVKEEFKKETENKHRQLSLIALQKGLCSSPAAVAGTLYKMAHKEEYPQKTKERLMRFFRMANDIKECRKLQAVIELLNKFDGKILIYTAFRRTMFFLQDELKKQGYDTTLFHGALSMKQKREALLQFENESRIMISTDAGSEGQNMQFCNYLINYDLPWNPMKVEQRIGRVHRLGQSKNVVIINFSVNNTIEADILDLLAKKIHMFELVIGEMDLILGAMNTDKSFETIMMEILATSKNDEEYKKNLEKFANDLVSAREKYLKIKETEEIVSNILEEG